MATDIENLRDIEYIDEDLDDIEYTEILSFEEMSKINPSFIALDKDEIYNAVLSRAVEKYGDNDAFNFRAFLSGARVLCYQNNKKKETQIDFILRDFDTRKLIEYGNLLKEITFDVLKNYPNSQADFIQNEQYRNMNEILKDHPLCISLAMEAMELAGLTPETTSIRGGTDGSRLTFMGLPCPNIFAGEHAFHSKEEWVSVQDMQKATETILYLAELYTVRF